MAQHLELSYTSEHSSDRRVLQLYPSSLTRRVLRWGMDWMEGRGEGGQGTSAHTQPAHRPRAAALPQLPHTQGAQEGVGRGKGGRGGTPGPLTSRSLNPKLSQVLSKVLCEEALRRSMSVPSHNINLVIHWIHTMCSSHYFAGTCTSVPCRSATCSAVAGQSSSTPCWRHVVQTSSCLM